MLGLGLVMLLQAATPPATAPITKQGQEVVDLFESMCVEAALKSTKAHQLDAQPDIARPMTSDELTNFVPGGVGTEGWIVRSPHGAWAGLWFAPSKRTCGVTVRAADPSGLEAALDAKLKGFYAAMGMHVTPRPDETYTVTGVTVHHAGWTVDLGSHQVAVIATFADKPIGARQHLMTFTLLH